VALTSGLYTSHYWTMSVAGLTTNNAELGPCCLRSARQAPVCSRGGLTTNDHNVLLPHHANDGRLKLSQRRSECCRAGGREGGRLLAGQWLVQ